MAMLVLRHWIGCILIEYKNLVVNRVSKVPGSKLAFLDKPSKASKVLTQYCILPLIIEATLAIILYT